MRYFVVVAVLLLTLSSARATTVIHDETFTTGTWTTTVLGGTGITGSTLTRIPNGGVTGDSQVTSLSHSTSTFTFEVLNKKIDRPWIPSIDGPITSLTWELWYKELAISLYLTATQGTSTYATAAFSQDGVSETNWKKALRPETPQTMLRRYGAGPLELDFSPTAEPIYFGYLLIRPIFTNRDSFQHSFFDIQIVPEPSSTTLSLLGASVIWMSWMVRRRLNQRSSRLPIATALL